MTCGCGESRCAIDPISRWARLCRTERWGYLSRVSPCICGFPYRGDVPVRVHVAGSAAKHPQIMYQRRSVLRPPTYTLRVILSPYLRPCLFLPYNPDVVVCPTPPMWRLFAICIVYVHAHGHIRLRELGQCVLILGTRNASPPENPTT